jgi:3-hydroxyacyl-CoA dehydrogenase/enoyl-CoA hydratase/3-hydroxybutyryl-CoA epimerase
MGPLTLSDEVGLDVGIKVLHILEDGLGERFKPADIFTKVFEKGLLGKKSGKGFYIHDAKERSVNKEIDTFRAVTTFSAEQQKEFQERMLLVMINEAARCLAEGVVDDPAAVDVGMVMGTGFPPFRAGLLYYADHEKIDNVVDSLTYFKERVNAVRFEPSPYLLDLQKRRVDFYTAENNKG